MVACTLHSIKFPKSVEMINFNLPVQGVFFIVCYFNKFTDSVLRERYDLTNKTDPGEPVFTHYATEGVIQSRFVHTQPNFTNP